MKSYMSISGDKRITVNIPTYPCATDIAYQLVSSFCYNAPDSIITKIKVMSKREVLIIYRDRIFMDGNEIASFRVGDNDLNETLDDVIKLILIKFPELLWHFK